MRKKLWISLALLFVIPGLLSTVSCAKKKIKSQPSITQSAKDEAAKKAAEQEELEKQRALEEERLKAEEEEAKQQEIIAAAKSRFENEDVYFDFDSSALLPMAQAVLEKKAEWLRNNSGGSVVIEGHCDERGTGEYNLALGDRRAKSAEAFLLDLGISASRLITLSYGEERPADSGHNEEAWAKNRRAHFIIE
ncbi:MAG: peptidoglycan-associated lipoprotein Pal [Desulfobacterales bacterium]|jgi:peptidoglycan-associated lipoprotein|nr:peptidoglycan-associated lipoprotein [Desulfobacter sp.]MDP6394351.1 peptidoglycan-associated lipoprotein Pal [Desulfobacterales bacterium]MDP6682378.1 peptidoglycan-associated lipoprotein Pal [Desulfobacterales bacterium]MDP6807574.1 peptidoglycan-associated lipoprotein Pal [Desulfobacterales bacterium]|tara:strand:- start:29441 stop:30019 length:579 start_codon:yes stop_codon:yes gene_type:complete